MGRGGVCVAADGERGWGGVGSGFYPEVFRSNLRVWPIVGPTNRISTSCVAQEAKNSPLNSTQRPTPFPPTWNECPKVRGKTPSPISSSSFCIRLSACLSVWHLIMYILYALCKSVFMYVCMCVCLLACLAWVDICVFK